MKVNHAWNKQPRAVPKLVPLQQVEAAVTIASHNTAAFTAQMVMEQMMLMLHEDFGFGMDLGEARRCAAASRGSGGLEAVHGAVQGLRRHRLVV